MAFELKAKDGGTGGVQRILLDCIDKALQTLAGRRPLRDQAVHQARKELKRARATLRLWRDGLSVAVYGRENAALRDGSKPLTEVRDAKVVLDTLDSLLEHFAAAAKGIALDDFRRRLRKDRLQLRRSILQSPRPLATSRRTLRQCRQRVARQPRQRDAWTVYSAGIQRIYRSGRRCFATARQERSAETLHDWRKSVKYLRHQLQILRPIWPGPIGELADQAHQLTVYLGEDHDLWVLRERMSQHSDALPDEASRSALAALIDRRRQELQDCALALGERLYLEKPGDFTRRLGEYWLNWRRESDSRKAQPIPEAPPPA